jgi:hypothetical protein
VIPLDYPHTAVVEREGRSVATQSTSFPGLSVVYASMACLVEPMAAWRQQTLLGEFAGLTWHITWGAEVLYDGDRVTWEGKTYVLRLHSNDQFRGVTTTTIPPYQTGFIEEEIRPRD